MFTKSRCEPTSLVESYASGFPKAQHPMEPDVFSRQAAMAAYDQSQLERAHIGIVGCGGLGSWIGLGLARMGVRRLTLFDPDTFDRTNAPRQLMGPQDLGQPKATALATNLLPHMTNAGSVRAVAAPAEDADAVLGGVTALVVGVDNNRARLSMASMGLRLGIPVVFAMLSRDGLRAQAFLQRPGGPCVSCVLPNLDPDLAAPCAAASIASCFLIAGHAVHLVVTALSGTACPEWREASLDGSRDFVGHPVRRLGCGVCDAYGWLRSPAPACGA